MGEVHAWWIMAPSLIAAALGIAQFWRQSHRPARYRLAYATDGTVDVLRLDHAFRWQCVGNGATWREAALIAEQMP